MRTGTGRQARTMPCDCPYLTNSHHRRACSGPCPMRACAAGGGSQALPALPAWSRACPATCSSPAPAPSPPARCLPAASTSTPTRLAAAALAPSLPRATASRRRNVSPGALGPAGGGASPALGSGGWSALDVVSLGGELGCTGASGGTGGVTYRKGSC